MGAHMARNLVMAGYKVTVHDVNENTMKKFSDDGIPTKLSPLEVSKSSDVVITMLPSSAHVLDVYNGRNGLLANGGCLGPWLYIDSSTVDPQTSRKISMDISRCTLKEKKAYAEKPMMLDAPVSGGVPAAEAGKLTFMVFNPCFFVTLVLSPGIYFGRTVATLDGRISVLFWCKGMIYR